MENPETIFIGREVIIDNSHPREIEIQKGTIIAARSIILGHEIDLDSLRHGKVCMKAKKTILKEHSFIGCNTVVLAGVTIGKFAVVGANSTVTKDIPDYSVCAGNPARPIKKKIKMN